MTEPLRMVKTYDGLEYLRVPEINGGCTGCQVRSDGCNALALCARSGNDEGIGAIWITNTPEGMTEYIALKLENS